MHFLKLLRLPVFALLAFIITAVLAPAPARADINLDDLAPKLTKCWGTTCVMPDASVNAVVFNLGTKKFEAGIVLARYFEVGYSRRFATDEAGTNYISIAGNVPWDVFTRATLPQRSARAKLGRVTAEDF
jgi:hypothetical protein